MKVVGFIGWRGMVGSVLMDRMRTEGDFRDFNPIFFSTSQAGDPGPDVGMGDCVLRDASELQQLAECDILVSCQGGDYTKSIHDPLRQHGWNGYWIDAASSLRMRDDTIIVLDPVNRKVIDQA